MSDKYKTFQKISLKLMKILSGLAIAYVIALVGQEFIRYGSFSFVFILISITMAFLYVMKGYGFITLFLIDFLLVVFAFLLRFYILWAYSS